LATEGVIAATSAIDLGTFAIIVSILVGVLTIWSGIRTARNEAKKAAETLAEFRTGAIDNLKDRINTLSSEIKIMKIQYHDRLEVMEKNIARLEQFSWGRDAKSTPFWIDDTTETKEHKGQKDVGIFKGDDT